MNEPHRFTLRDHAGTDHDYLLTLHLASDGTAIALRLAAMLAGPVTQLLATLVAEEGLIETVAQHGLEGVPTTAISEAFSGLGSSDFSTALARALADKSAAPLVRDLVRHVSRDGKPLSSGTEFDRAFSGNYGELYRLLWEVVRVNRFLSF